MNNVKRLLGNKVIQATLSSLIGLIVVEFALNLASPDVELLAEVPPAPVVVAPVPTPVPPGESCATEYVAIASWRGAPACAINPTLQLAANGAPDKSWFADRFDVDEDYLMPQRTCECLKKKQPYIAGQDQETPIDHLFIQDQKLPIEKWVCLDTAC